MELKHFLFYLHLGLVEQVVLVGDGLYGWGITAEAAMGISTQFIKVCTSHYP